MIKKILLHLIDIFKSPYLILFLLYKYIFFDFLGFKTKPISNIKIISPSLDKTFIRWGDGETSAALGISISFEKSSNKLKKYLNNIIKYKKNNILLGLPIKFISKEESKTEYLNIWKITRIYLNLVLNRESLREKKYGDAFFFRDIGSINNLSSFYSGKDLFIVSNENTIKNINKVNFKNIGTFIIPNKNAFDNYYTIKDNLLKVLELYDKKEDLIILVSGGPFAKALCYDLTIENNFICHDVGAVFDIYLK